MQQGVVVSIAGSDEGSVQKQKAAASSDETSLPPLQPTYAKTLNDCSMTSAQAVLVGQPASMGTMLPASSFVLQTCALGQGAGEPVAAQQLPMQQQQHQLIPKEKSSKFFVICMDPCLAGRVSMHVSLPFTTASSAPAPAGEGQVLAPPQQQHQEQEYPWKVLLSITKLGFKELCHFSLPRTQEAGATAAAAAEAGQEPETAGCFVHLKTSKSR